MNYRFSKTNEVFISFFIKLFILVNLFFPYVNKINYRNCTFILSNLIAGILIILLMLKKNINNVNKKYIFIFTIVLIIYNIFAFINNYNYNHYFIEQVNKDISFMFFIFLLLKIDYDFLDRHKILEFLFFSIIMVLVLSTLFRICGGDAIQIQNFGIMLTRKGTFSDNRLTWVFGHKSTYALLIILFVSIALKFKYKFRNNKYFIAFIAMNLLVAIEIKSNTLIILLILIFTASYLKKIGFKNNKILKSFIICLIIILAVGIFIVFLKYITTKRDDISTLGNRTNIYITAIQTLPLYPNGVGKDFGDIYLYTVGETIENLHNIFLNEMFRFSVKVGIVYFILHLLIVLKGGMKNIVSFATIVSCFGLFFMDYALRTEQLSIYFFLIFIILDIVIPSKEKNGEVT